ncbi:S-adenosyl-L-methionine-dependent methyltransferase [Cunninghamella echinulata]|nr:S-adenosyl-L-methionine-dependent methyltransferase [Cunninghamella echinulata]
MGSQHSREVDNNYHGETKLKKITSKINRHKSSHESNSACASSSSNYNNNNNDNIDQDYMITEIQPNSPTTTTAKRNSPFHKRANITIQTIPVNPVRHQVVLSEQSSPLSTLTAVATKHIRKNSTNSNNNNNNNNNKRSSSYSKKSHRSSFPQQYHHQLDLDNLSAASAITSDDDECKTFQSSSRSFMYSSSADSSTSLPLLSSPPSTILHRTFGSSHIDDQPSHHGLIIYDTGYPPPPSSLLPVSPNNSNNNNTNSNNNNNNKHYHPFTNNNCNYIQPHHIDHHYNNYHHPHYKNSNNNNNIIISQPVPNYDIALLKHQQQLKYKGHSHKLKWVYDYYHDQEYNRQLRLHYILKQIFGKNIMVSLDEPPNRILDSNCGNGLWAWETSQEYQQTKVIGIDIQLPNVTNGTWLGSSTSSSYLTRLQNHSNVDGHVGNDDRDDQDQTKSNRNISFIYGDILKPLTFDDDSFDFIHQRQVGTFMPFQHWPFLLNEFYRLLRPGGKLQLVEQDILYKNPGPGLSMINEWYCISCKEMGVNPRFSQFIKDMLINSGFEQIEVKEYIIPIGEWSSDQTQKQHGFLYKQQISSLFKTVQPLWLYEIGMTKQEYDSVCKEAMEEFEEYNTSVTWKIFTAIKPQLTL